MTKKRSRYLILGGLIWLVLVGSGFSYLFNYSGTPGPQTSPNAQWPLSSSLERCRDRATLVMAIHPRCACSRASLAELARVMARCPNKLGAYILVVRPRGAGDNWEKTDLWDQAAGIPGVKVLSDIDGQESARFEALTSGQTVVYNSEGVLIFSGGITGARGHAGDNWGEDMLVCALSNGKAKDRNRSAVFGCSIFSPARGQ